MDIGAVIHSCETCSSTNDLAKELALGGAPEGTVVLAEEQTAGKGTKGRSWHSPHGRGLYASIILRPAQSDISLLPLVAGVAVAAAVRRAAGLEVGLKWPNDVVWGGKKLGGILCESGFLGNIISYAILGVGLNVGQRRADFPPDISPAATSLRLITGKDASRDVLERSLWQTLDVWYKTFVEGRKSEIVQAFLTKLIFPIGTVINILRDKERLTGLFRGLDLQGRLILETGEKTLILSPAEILSIDYNSLG